MGKVVQFRTRLQLTPERWINSNPDMFFEASDEKHRRCHLCAKRIPAGVSFLGAYRIRLVEGEVVISPKVAFRVHVACADEFFASERKPG